MYKIITLSLLVTVACFNSAAQKKQPDTLRKFLDSRLAFTNKANMEFPALALRDADHWLLISVYPDTAVLLRAYFLDEKLTIKDGPFTLYHPKRIKAIQGNFVNNIKQGPWQSWHTNGQLKDSGIYINNHLTGAWYSWNDSGRLISIHHYLDSTHIKTVPRGTVNPREKHPAILSGDTSIGILDGPAMTFYPNGQMRDSGTYKLNRKEGTWKYWYSNGHLESVGTYVHNAQEGEWEYYRETGIRSSREKYTKNKVTALACFDEQGNPSGNACAILKPPVALGKFMDFDKYALDNMFWPEPLKRTDIEGTVEIEYTISQEGKLKNLKVISSPHKLMTEEVFRFFRTLQWSPAVSHNRPIEYTMKYSVPFYR